MRGEERERIGEAEISVLAVAAEAERAGYEFAATAIRKALEPDVRVARLGALEEAVAAFERSLLAIKAAYDSGWRGQGREAYLFVLAARDAYKGGPTP